MSFNHTKGVEGALSPPYQFTPPIYQIPPDPNSTFTTSQESSDAKKSKILSRTSDPQIIKKIQIQHYKTYMYQLIAKQLQDDGYDQLSKDILSTTSTPPFEHITSIEDPKSIYYEKQPLAEIMRDGITYRHENRFNLDIGSVGGMGDKTQDQINNGTTNLNNSNSGVSGASGTISGNTGTGNGVLSNGKIDFLTRFITTHKGPCSCAAFSSDGAYVITGSHDSSLKLLSVEKMHYHTQTKLEVEDYALARPVIKTYYDHSQEINDVTCHPREPIICSASKDCTVKLFNFSKNDRKRAFKHIQETHSVRTVGFHPSGDYLLVGTDHHIVRLYNLNTSKCFISSNHNEDHHYASLNCAKFSPDGRLWATASADGSIKLWDGTNGRVIKTIPHAHGKGQTYTVMFSRNSRYLLTNGEDGLGKLWDLRTWQQVNVYRPPQFSSQSHRHHITFSYDEKLVIGSRDSNILIWDSKSANLVEEIVGHNKTVTCVTSSPVENAFVSCSEDARARFFCPIDIGIQR